MKLFGIVVATYPQDRASAILSSGLSKRAIVSWNSVINSTPKRLDCDDVVEFDFTQKNGKAIARNIRILSGHEELLMRYRVGAYRRTVR